MKEIKSLGVFTIVTLFFSFTGFDCDTEVAKSNGIKNLDEGCCYLKSFAIDAKKKECSFIFSRGTEYMLTSALSNSVNTNVEIQLFDKSKKLIFSNYNKKKGTFSKVLYPCTSTGVHYISYIDHSSNQNICGVGVVGFKK